MTEDANTCLFAFYHNGQMEIKKKLTKTCGNNLEILTTEIYVIDSKVVLIRKELFVNS